MMPNDPLPLWNDSPARAAILDFVARVTKQDGPDFVPPEARIAAFDNDGTLWCEKPFPIQLGFILQRWVEMAAANPALADEQPWKSAVERDYSWLGGVLPRYYQGDDSDIPLLLKGVLAAFAGFTVEEFAARAEAFLRGEVHPTLQRPYVTCVYAPMIDLLRYLEANGFTNYIVSGGGRDFMRPVTTSAYGIPPDRVIGSSVSLEFRGNGDSGDLVVQPQLDVLNDGPAKPARIWSRVGQRPILAAGNSNGDIEMLQFTNEPSRPGLRLLVLHNDATREFDYVGGAEKALDLARQYGWTVVRMLEDWKTVFA